MATGVTDSVSVQILEESAARFHLIHEIVSFGVAARRSGVNSASLELEMLRLCVARETHVDELDIWPLDPVKAVGLTMDYAVARDIVKGGRAAVPEDLVEALRKRDRADIAGSLANDHEADATALWCFGLTMCYRLLLGQSRIPAVDARCLGLVDHIIE
jgi:hypothetical protein